MLVTQPDFTSVYVVPRPRLTYRLSRPTNKLYRTYMMFADLVGRMYIAQFAELYKGLA